MVLSSLKSVTCQVPDWRLVPVSDGLMTSSFLQAIVASVKRKIDKMWSVFINRLFSSTKIVVYTIIKNDENQLKRKGQLIDVKTTVHFEKPHAEPGRDINESQMFIQKDVYDLLESLKYSNFNSQRRESKVANTSSNTQNFV